MQGGLHSTSHFRLNGKDVHDVRKPGLPLESYARNSSMACVKWLAAPASEAPATWSSWGHRLRGEGQSDQEAAKVARAANRACAPGSDFTTGRKPARRGGCPGNCGLWSLELVLARGRGRGRGGAGRGCTAPNPWPGQLCSRLGALPTCLPRLGKGSRKGWGGEVSWAQSQC